VPIADVSIVDTRARSRSRHLVTRRRLGVIGDNLRDNASWATAGHVDVVDGESRAYLYVKTPSQGVDCAIAEDGSVAFAASRSIYGVTTVESADVDVTLGFANQYADEDVGLVYNRYRWYDPRLGLYISVDPLLARGTLNPRDYVSNPRWLIDPMGEAPRRPATRPKDDSAASPSHPVSSVPAPTSSADMTRSYMTSPGHWATTGDPGGPPGFVTCPDSALTDSGDELGNARTSDGRTVRTAIDEAGRSYGCHSCGTKNPNGPDATSTEGHFVPDHIPPVSTFADGVHRGTQLSGNHLAAVSGRVRLFPHCRQCSNSQGGMMSRASDADRTAMRTAAGISL
jgi:RHS repeat-associated protein